MTSTIKVNNIQNQCGANIINESSNTITIGASGDTIALASGASQSGFGREGSVNWQTSSIKTGSSFSAVSGEGYFIDTSSNTVTANLPAGSAGAIVAFSDYARNFETNKLTISPNGSEKIGGVAANIEAKVNGQALTLVYVNATKGWINVQNAEDTETGGAFITATGGTSTTCGDLKIHTFTGPGTFCVSAAAGSQAVADYLVIGGGAGGGTRWGAGGGAGGYRESHCATTSGPYTASPLASSTSLPISVQGYPITVGAGGTIICRPNGDNPNTEIQPDGGVSTFSTITSAGGGAGSPQNYGYSIPATPTSDVAAALAGGSGGGGQGRHGPASCGAGAGSYLGGAGNTPPVTPPQGNPGGTAPGAVAPSPDSFRSGGGGGAGGAGVGGFPLSGNGGNGIATEITGSSVTRAGGGGGAWGSGPGASGSGGAAGPGGGGTGGSIPGPTATTGTANTGGGGGGGAYLGAGNNEPGKAGGSGIVVIRYRFQ